METFVVVAKRSRTRAWNTYQKALNTGGNDAVAQEAHRLYLDACRNVRLAEWEACGGASGNIPRPA